MHQCPTPPLQAVNQIPSELVDRWKQPEQFEQVRQNIKYAHTIPPEAYYDPGYHEAEMQQIFGKQWFCVGHTAEIPKRGDTKVVDVGSQSFILTHDKKGKFNCFYNVCRHRGARLIEDGEVQNRKRLNCPYHWWSYRLSGDLVSTPFFKEGDGFRKKDYSLLKVQCEAFAGMIFINPDPNAEPLREKLGCLDGRLENFPLGEMQLLGAQSYDLDCDWKLLAENFMEWYHVAPVHPELAKFSTPDKHFMHEGSGQFVGFKTHPVTNCGGPADTDLFHPTPNTNSYDQETAFFYHLFPNVSVTIYPHSVYTLVMLPTGPGTCRETLYLLQHPNSRLESDSDEVFQQKVDNLMKFVTKVNDEDIDIVNKVSKGLKNRTYRGGRFSPDMEMTCYRFQNMIADSMVDRNLVFPPSVTDYYEHVYNPSKAQSVIPEEPAGMFIPEMEPEPMTYTLVEVDENSGVAKVVMEDISASHTIVQIDPESDSIKVVELGEALSNACENAGVVECASENVEAGGTIV